MFGMFTWAFAATSNMMVSNIIGQGKEDKVINLIHKIVTLSMGIAVVLAIILNIFPHAFLSIYGQGEEFIQQAIPVVRVISIALVLMSFATVWLNSVTGTGQSKVNLMIEIAAIIAYSLYVYFILEIWNLSIIYGWMSEWLYWMILFTLSFYYIRSGKWKGKKI